MTLPYGLQREMLMFAARDQRGRPRTHRYANAWEVLRIRGKLDVDALFDSAVSAADSMSVLSGRFHQANGIDIFEYIPDTPRLDCTFIDSREFGKRGVVDTLCRAANQARDLQDDPPVQVVVARLNENEHVLLLSMDHSVSDGRTLVLFLRRLVDVYGKIVRTVQAGDASRNHRPFPDFWEFVRSVSKAEENRAAAFSFWKGALSRAEDDRTRPEFPGGRWKPRADRAHTAVHQDEWNQDETLGLRTLAAAHQIHLNLLLLAALSIATSAWSEAFTPINYMRHGRSFRESINVPGVLAEHAVTIPGGDGKQDISSHLTVFAHCNGTTPSYFGLAQREMESAASDENRLVLFNFLPPIPPLLLGDAAMTPDPYFADLLSPLGGSNRFGARVQVVHDPGQKLKITVHSDSDILPRPESLARALRHVVDIAKDQPDLPTTAVMEQIRRTWH